MTAKSPYARVRENMADQREAQAGPPAVQGNCRYCDAPTGDDTLRALGARCRPCFAQFFRLGYSGPEPARQCAPAPWIAAARDAIAARHPVEVTTPPAGAAGPALALAALELAGQAQRPGRMDLDDINAALQAEA